MKDGDITGWHSESCWGNSSWRFFCLLIFWGIYGIFESFKKFISWNQITNVPNWILVTVLLILSYIAGNVIRLRQADKVDRKSGEFLQKTRKIKQDYVENLQKSIDETENEIKTGKLTQNDLEKHMKKLEDLYNQYYGVIYIVEKFPYPKWEERKRNLYHSENYQKFFSKYQREIIAETKEFFNFCKTVVSELSPQLREEIYHAESLTRFFAGIYFSVTIGIIILLMTGSLQLIYRFIFNMKINPMIFGISIILFLIFYLVRREILQRFRFIRLKEVDTVYDAFYVVCKRRSKIEF